MRKWIVLLVVLISKISLEGAYPVDISFLVADVKFNQKQGVKICEVQQGTVSLFKGYDYLYNGQGLIGENFAKIVNSYNDRVCFIPRATNFVPSKKKFKLLGWKDLCSLKELLGDCELARRASQRPKEPSLIEDYGLILYGREKYIGDVEEFREKFPGVLLVDAPTWSYWIDKYKMSLLFLGDERLENVKPKWNLYPKSDSLELAEQILSEIPSEYLVIKPRSSAEGRGVIIFQRDQLSGILKKIFSGRKKLKRHPDKGYKWWYRDLSDSFLVEEFIESDPVRVAKCGNKLFNGTMRVVFCLIYDRGEVHLHYLGEYWIIPDRSINETGSLSQKHKASMIHPHVCRVDPLICEEVKNQLREPLILMYKKMLGIYS